MQNKIYIPRVNTIEILSKFLKLTCSEIISLFFAEQTGDWHRRRHFWHLRHRSRILLLSASSACCDDWIQKRHLLWGGCQGERSSSPASPAFPASTDEILRQQTSVGVGEDKTILRNEHTPFFLFKMTNTWRLLRDDFYVTWRLFRRDDVL